MKRITRHKILLVALVVYLAAVAGSVALNELRRESLQFHTRDYNYYIEQAAKLADPRLTNRFALNVEGNNFIGLQGTEGVRSIYQAIHSEYFRYTYTVLYALFHSALPLYIFFCALFFLPLIYMAFILRSRPGAWKQVGFYLALFLLFPGLVSSVTEDLRSRMLFVSAWTLLALAIYYRRPFIEKLVFFWLPAFSARGRDPPGGRPPGFRFHPHPPLETIPGIPGPGPGCPDRLPGLYELGRLYAHRCLV